jgi:hypothetical protein
VLSDQEAEEDGDLRIIDESDEDHLFPAAYFVLIEVPNERAQAIEKSYAWSMQIC